MRFFAALLGVSILACLPAGSPAWAQESDADRMTPEQQKFFETRIRPVLVSECYGCHSKQSGQAKGGLQLDSKNAIRLGGDSGPSVVPGDLDSSLLFSAINHDDFIMPPKRKLSSAQIADFRTWILSGAPDPRIAKPIDKPVQTVDEELIQQAKQNFWAYQTPRRTDLSTLGESGKSWSKTTIDRFLFQTLEDRDMKPSDDADATTVLRRLCFDLVGLPPTLQQVDWFLKAYEQDPDAAIQRVVDGLLEMPQFGEHWGRHWLDVVRYAESTGREVNMTYPNAWRYRDYVIDAFNDDKPFDQFVQEQLAGDLIPAKDDREWSEHLIGTAFLAIGTKNVNEQSGVQFAADLADEQIDATTRVFLGTSVACARCHDHKFDPIRQQDYYAMAGIFRSTKTFFGTPPSQYGSIGGPQLRRSSSLILLPVDDNETFGPSYSESELAAMHEEVRSIREQLVALRPGRSGDAAANQRNRIRLQNQLATLSNKLGVVDESGQPRSYCMGVQDESVPQDAPLLVRGEIDQPSDRVSRGVPMALSNKPLAIGSRGSGRLELARWIGSDENSLTARVMVNRIWHHVFGQGIVPTTEDFGMTGTYPSHPELLDHLAIEFVESNWSIKSMIKQMVSSRAYRMSSTFDDTYHEQDPDNRLLWRSHIKRLPAESIRDAMLVISKQLETGRPSGSMVAKAGYTRVRGEQLGDPRDLARRIAEQTLIGRRGNGQLGNGQLGNGQGQRPQPRSPQGGFLRGRFSGRGGFSGGMSAQDRSRMIRQAYEEASLDSVQDNHRSVYLPVVRDFVPRSLEVFDFADPSMVTGVREASNTPNQALFMMNNPLTLRLSEDFASRILSTGKNHRDRIDLAFRMAYGRPPSDAEMKASLSYLNDSELLPKSAFTTFCQSLFAAAEFRYLN